MSAKSHSRKTRDVIAALHKDGWNAVRRGPGDHIQFKHPAKTLRISIDNGEPEIPTGTLRTIYRIAGWEW